MWHGASRPFFRSAQPAARGAGADCRRAAAAAPAQFVQDHREQAPPSRPIPLGDAAMLMLAIGGVGGWAIRGATEAPARVIAALAQEAGLLQGVRLLSYPGPCGIARQHRARGVGVEPPAPGRSSCWDLSKSGYRFMGGRVVPTAHGPAAMLMYDDDRGDRLVVLTRPMTSDQNSPMAPQAFRGRLHRLFLGRRRNGPQPGGAWRSRAPEAACRRHPQAGADDLFESGASAPGIDPKQRSPRSAARPR